MTAESAEDEKQTDTNEEKQPEETDGEPIQGNERVEGDEVNMDPAKVERSEKETSVVKANEDVVQPVTYCKPTVQANSKKVVEYVVTEMTEVIGNYGPWHRSVFILCLLTCFPFVWQEVNYSFATFKRDHWCSPPEELSSIMNSSVHVHKWKSQSIPSADSNEYANPSCQMFQYSSTDYNEWLRFFNDYSKQPNLSPGRELVPCKGWQFNETDFGETIIERWNLVCRKSDQVFLGSLIYTIGCIVSVIIFGALGDRIGRRPVMIICFSVMQIGSVFIAFSYSYVFYVVLRFAVGMGAAGLFTVSFVTLMEISGPAHRLYFGMTMAFFTSLALVIFPWLAEVSDSWTGLQLITAIPCIVIMAFLWPMLESPRWLLSRGKLPRARRAVDDAAEKNHKSVAQIYVTGNALFKYMEKKFKMQLIMSDNGKIETKSITDFMKKPILKQRALVLFFCWFVGSLSYNGLLVGDEYVAGKLYLHFFVIGLAQAVGMCVTYFAMKRFRRRIPLSVLLMAACVMCLAIIPVPSGQDVKWVQDVFSVLGYVFVASASAILYIITSEVFPTILRCSGIGYCSAFAGLGTIVAPFISNLATVAGKGIPLGIYAALLAIAAVLVLRLPETHLRQIPDDLEEAEKIHLAPMVSSSVNTDENSNL